MRTILPQEKNPTLRDKAQKIPVEDIGSPHIQQLIKEMKALLLKEKYGVALAAPQVSEPLRLFIVSGKALARDARNAPDEPGSDDAPEPPPLPDQVYINPELVKLSRQKQDKHEGCLSVRGKWGEVPRAEKATIRAYDENGKKIERGASGFLAHIFQHEMDHLDGVLYTDKATHVYEEKDEKMENE
jgi:peptide deformylase